MGAEISYACNCNSDARQEPGGAVKEVINVIIILLTYIIIKYNSKRIVN